MSTYKMCIRDRSEINQVFRKLQNLNIELEQKQDLLAQEIRIKSNEANICLLYTSTSGFGLIKTSDWGCKTV